MRLVQNGKNRMLGMLAIRLEKLPTNGYSEQQLFHNTPITRKVFVINSITNSYLLSSKVLPLISSIQPEQSAD